MTAVRAHITLAIVASLRLGGATAWAQSLPVGDDFRVDTGADPPDSAADLAGNSTTVFTTEGAAGRRFGYDGLPLTTSFTLANGAGARPQVAMDEGGATFFAWAVSNDHACVSYAASNASVPPPGVLPANELNCLMYVNSLDVALSAGRGLVVGAQPSTGAVIKGKYFASGLGPEFPISADTTTNGKSDPAVASAGPRDLVTWIWDRSPAPDAVYVRLFKDMQAQTGDLLVVAGSVSEPAVAGWNYLKNGTLHCGFVVVWREVSSASVPLIRAQRFKCSDDPQFPALEPQLPVLEVGSGGTPAVGANRNGDGFFIAWHVGSTVADIHGRMFHEDGTAATGEFVVNTTVAGAQTSASVAAGGDGRYFVSWRSANGQEIRARRYAASGDCLIE